jgi:hypothetical protein
MFLEFVGGALMHPRRQSGCWARTTVLQPGQVVQRQFRSDQLAGWQPQSSNVRALAGTPDPGDYLLVAEYGDGQFETSFRVVHFDLEAHTKLKLQEPKVVQLDDGRTATYERSVEGFVLARGGKRYVAVQASWNSRPAIRVAELEPDESLDGLEEGRDGRITARIRSGSGRVRLADRPEPDQMPQ